MSDVSGASANNSMPRLELPDGVLGSQALESAERIGSAYQGVEASPRQHDSAAPMLGVAGLGKTALALAFILLLVWGMAALLKRIGPGRRLRGGSLHIIASQSLGAREKVVVVEIEQTWLVLGVSPGGVSRLHEMPARQDGDLAGHTGPTGHTQPGTPSFADSFKTALSQRFQRRS